MTLLTSVGKKSATAIINCLRGAGVKNLRFVNETCVSGATLERFPGHLKKIKDSGINTIIDFRQEASSQFAEACEKSGLRYILFPLEHTRSGLSGISSAGQVGEISDDFVKQLKDFMDIINEGNAYMGCNFGIDRTNLGLVFNYLLNSKSQLPPKILTWGDFRTKSVINKTLKIARKIIKRMTPEQKAYLGIPENYNEIFQEKISRMLASNLYS